MGGSGESNPVSQFLNPIPLLLREAEKRKRVGDRYFLTRQHEHFMAEYDGCGCGHTCGGCAAVLAIATQLERLIPPEDDSTDRERQRARAFRIADERGWRRVLSMAQAFWHNREQARKTPTTEQTRAEYIARAEADE